MSLSINWKLALAICGAIFFSAQSAFAGSPMPTPLGADLVSGPACVDDNTPTSFAWKITNNDTKGHTLVVHFFGVVPSDPNALHGGPSIDVNLAASHLTPTVNGVAVFVKWLKPGQSTMVELIVNSVPENFVRSWDPSWGPLPTYVQRFYYSAFANLRSTTYQRTLEALPAYCQQFKSRGL